MFISDCGISVSEAVLCRFDGNGIFVRLVVSFLINLENCFIQKFDVRSCDEQKSKQKTKTYRDLSLSVGVEQSMVCFLPAAADLIGGCLSRAEQTATGRQQEPRTSLSEK